MMERHVLIAVAIAAAACSSSGSTSTPLDASVEGAAEGGEDASVADARNGGDASADTSPVADAGVDVTGATDAGDSGTDAANGDKRVFVTTATLRGDFGGLDAADTVCRNEAGDAGLGTNFVAWLSLSPDFAADAGADGGPPHRDAIDRITTDGPFVRVDGAALWASKSALVTSPPSARLLLTATGSTIADTDHVWTGTVANGTAPYPYKTCGDWTNSSNPNLMGYYGVPGATQTQLWSGYDVEACTATNHVYCFEN